MQPMAQLSSMNEDQEVCSETLRVLHCAHIPNARPTMRSTTCDAVGTKSGALVVRECMVWNTEIRSYTRSICGKACSQTGVSHVQVESKLFYLDLKRNARGRYLKIAEKGTNRERSTIIVPYSGIMWFRELFNYYAGGTNEQG